MERRSFLRGLVIGGGAALIGEKIPHLENTALVRVANPEEVTMLERAKKFTAIPDGRTREMHPMQLLFEAFQRNEPLYVSIGNDEFMPIGYPRSVNAVNAIDEMSYVDVTLHGMDNTQMLEGIRRRSIEMELIVY